MSKIQNLNKFRKARAKAEHRKQADANAVKFGRTRFEKDLEKARQSKEQRDHNNKERE